MNKMLLVAVAAGIMSTSAMAGVAVGTVADIIAKNDGTVKVIIHKEDGSFSNAKSIGTLEIQKVMLAIVLSAKAVNATVHATSGTVDDTPSWTAITIK